jgi:TOMM system kinase/cyclase fusion protein
MTFEEILDQALTMLQRRGRVTYGTLQRQFALDADALEDLKEALLYAHPQVVDDQGRGLLWTGDVGATPSCSPAAPPPASPRAQPDTLGATPQVPDAERRQLTVLFCDLMDSTALASQLDPEELRELVRAYQQACGEVVQKFEGHIAQYLGDGLLVYFGYPQAHEDDAQRAVRAGLGIVEAVRGLNTKGPARGGVRLAVRIGIHTGLVVVGEVGGRGKQEHLALGETPNLAARLQALAEPDRVVISGATLRLVDGFFVTRELGPQVLKGVPAPVPVFEVTGEGPARSRLDVVAPVELTPLVGREQEVGLLLDRWEQVEEGRGQVVLLTGEPGIGKSRLVQVVKERVAEQPHRRLECRCSPYYTNTPLYPVTDLLPRLFGWSRDETAEGKLEKLEQGLGASGAAPDETLPLLAALLALPAPERYPLPPMSPERQKQRTLEALLGLLHALAARQPVILIVEDLHWVDPTTLEWLALVIEQAPTTRLLVLPTARPTFAAPWPARAHLTALTLSRFTRKQTEAMVDRVTGGTALPTEVLQQIVAKTDGVPLFVEELTKMVLESGLLAERGGRYELTGPLPPLAIPSTLQDSLMARLDRLAAVKEVAQLGAALGREFPYGLIRAVSHLDAAALGQALGRLVEAELLYQRGVPPAATYTFKHALVQEAAYQSLLKSTRQQYHQRIARTMLAQFPAEAETRPEFIAHHYTEAGLATEAIPYWQRAGQRAVERSAHAEAAGHYLKALDGLATLPESPERDGLELGLQVALAYAWAPSKGWAAPQVERAYTRARALCRHAPEGPHLFGALRGLWVYYIQGDHRSARELADQCVALADRAQEPGLLVEAHFARGATANYRGDFVLARRELERSLSLYDREAHRRHAYAFGQDPYVAASLYLVSTLWRLGYPEEALRHSTQAVEYAQQLAHPFSLAYALHTACMLRTYRREWPEVQKAADAALTQAAEHGFSIFMGWAHYFLGIARAHQGQPQQGRDLIERQLLRFRAMGTEIAHGWMLASLAEACLLGHQLEEAAGFVDEALTLVEKNDERFSEAGLHQIKGELLLLGPRRDEEQAEVELHRALEIARRQQAKSLELRAAMNLARLWQQQGKRAEAHALLAPIYGWFTEGFDTADLQEAKALLEEGQS